MNSFCKINKVTYKLSLDNIGGLMHLPQETNDVKINMLNDFNIIFNVETQQNDNIEKTIQFLQHWVPYYNGSLKNMFNDLGIEISFKNIMDFKEAQEGLIDPQLIKDHKYNFDILIYECEKIINTCKANDRNELFLILKKYTWDLYSIIDSIAINTFQNLIIEKNDLFRVYLNAKELQNFTTSIQSFLLIHYNLIDFKLIKDFNK